MQADDMAAAMTGMRRSIRPRGNDSARGDRGAVAVEAGLILPLFLLLVLGVVEFGLLVKDKTAVSESARVGVRTASALSKELGFTQSTANAIQRAGSAMNKDDIEFIIVYKANQFGLPGSFTPATFPADAAGVCGGTETTCDKFVWNKVANRFDPTAPPGWEARSVNACLPDPDDVGVYVQAKHRMVTGLFGGTRLLSDRAVLQFEPRGAGQCRPT